MKQEMRFHAKPVALLNVDANVSEVAVSSLNQVESRIGRKLPASVREWYSLEGAVELLRRFSNDDPPLEISELGLPRKDTHGGGPHDLLARNLIVFRYENQAVCVWAFRLDGSDDPPVFLDFDSQFRTWSQCARSFSEHLYTWAWDYALVLKRELLVQAQNQPLTDDALSFLRMNFDVGIETNGWPANTQYRFSKDDKRILIWAGDKQADWWLSAETAESLRELIERIGECDRVRQSMWSHSERGEALLENGCNE